MTSPGIARPNTQRTDRTFIQRNAEAALTPHPFRVELRGKPGSLAWPSVCANCGTMASERIAVRKAFPRPRRRGRGSRRNGLVGFATTEAQVPFCGGCAGLHRQTVVRKSATGNLLRALLTPMLIPMAGSAFFFVITLRAVIENPPNGQFAQMAWGLPALMAGIFIWSLIAGWRSTAADRLEAQTDVTRACDFSDDVSWLFEGERRIYSMRNETFARSFADANRDQVWTAADDARTSRRMVIGLVAAGVVGAVVWLFVVLGP